MQSPISHLCVHCPADFKVTDLLEEPAVVCAGRYVAVIRVAYAYGARRVDSLDDLDYFVYRARTGAPTLRLLPHPKPLFFDAREVGFLPFSADGGEDFLMAVIRPQPRRGLLQYDLHVFCSKRNRWTSRPAVLQPPSPRYETEFLVHRTDRAIGLGGGVLGWVDLWRGIVTCDVLARAPVLRYIHFPESMPGNLRRYLVENPARRVRDVTCTADGILRFVVPAAAPPSNDPRMSVAAGLDTENSTRPAESVLDGWTAATWRRNATDRYCSNNGWRMDCRAYVSESSVLSLLRPNHPEDSALQSPIIALFLRPCASARHKILVWSVSLYGCTFLL